jgi:peptidoglycan/xylan/chitin deacetylase (PgdA/CDA1 family)
MQKCPVQILGCIVFMSVLFVATSQALEARSETYARDQLTSESHSSSSDYKSYYVYSGPKDSNLIALTYDDGPNSRFTPHLVEILKKKQVPATFFFIGEQVELYPSEAKFVADMGFEIGNHTYSHPNLRKLSCTEIQEELTKTQEIIKSTTGVTPALFRPPYMLSNRTVVELAQSMNLAIVFWSVDTEDWKPSTTKEEIVEAVMSQVTGGSIILMHDRNTKTLQATEEIIDLLRAQGYEFATISRLLEAIRDTAKQPASSGQEQQLPQQPNVR